MGRLSVGLSPVGLRHAGVDKLVQCPPQGGPDEGRTAARAGGGGSFELPGQGLVELDYELLHHICSILNIYEMSRADRHRTGVWTIRGL